MIARPKPKSPKRLRSRSRTSTVSICAIGLMIIFGVAIIVRPNPDVSKPRVQIVNNDDFLLLPTPSRNIAKGESLGDVSFIFVKWPKSDVVNEYAKDLSSLRNGYAVTPLAKSAPIPMGSISSNIADINQVIEGIPVGMRAITIKVDAESAVEGWAQSGNYVDVILVRNGTEKVSGRGLEGKVIAENIKILSAGRVAEPSRADKGAPKSPSTVTLLTSQEDALKIKLAVTIGKITFSLRGANDQDPATTSTMDQRVMLGKDRSTDKDKEVKGIAKGPDGKSYVLGLEGKWVESNNAS